MNIHVIYNYIEIAYCPYFVGKLLTKVVHHILTLNFVWILRFLCKDIKTENRNKTFSYGSICGTSES